MVFGEETDENIMTDEVLFKAKREDNNNWIEGYYMYHINRTLSPIDDSLKKEDIEHIILFDGFSDWNMHRDIKYVHIVPETLCRYIGIKDKNGIKVFTNDVVKCYTGRICKVVPISCNSYVGYDLIPIDGFDKEPPKAWSLYYDIEVIGNIYDGNFKHLST